MSSGEKSGVEKSGGEESCHRVVIVILFLLISSFGSRLFKLPRLDPKETKGKRAEEINLEYFFLPSPPRKLAGNEKQRNDFRRTLNFGTET